MVRKHCLYLSLWPLLLSATLLWASGFHQAPSVPRAVLFPHFDKVVHFFVFGLLGTLIYRHPFFRGRGVWRMLLAVALTSVFGLIDELRQFTNPARYFQCADWGVDTIGGITAITMYVRWTLYRKILETRLDKWITGRGMGNK